MRMCWEENSEDRPDFQSLRKILGEISGCEQRTEVRQIGVNFHRICLKSHTLNKFKLSV